MTRIRPKNGTRVLMPDGTVLPDAGANVVFDLYWQRRLDDDDIEIVSVDEEHA